MPAGLAALALSDARTCAGVVLRPYRARADQDHVGEFAQQAEQRPIAGPAQATGGAADGGAAVEAGDEVRPKPDPVQLRRVAVELGQFAAVEFADRAEQSQLHPAGWSAAWSDMGMIATRRYGACMHGPTSADATGGVAHLVDRQPTVSPERLIAQLTPPPTFAEVSFASYHPDPAEPTQSAAVAACQQFCRQAVERRAGRKKLFGRREVLPGVGLYLDGGFGVGKTHLLAAAYRQLPDDLPDKKPTPRRSRRSWS